MTVQIPDLTDEQLAEAARLYAEKNPPKPPEGQDVDSLPEWARKAITKGNSEAAEFRTKLREAEQKLANAKTPEDVAAATKEWQEKYEASERKALDAARTVAKVTYGLPDRVATKLDGATADEITADAQAWAKELGLVGEDGKPVPTRTPRTPGGGLKPPGGPAGDGTEKYDPAALALEVEKTSGRR